MDKKNIDSFKTRLLEERKDVEDILKLMKKNETIDSNITDTAELSLYDNHPADIASELYAKESGMALKENELNILNKIDSALKMIDEGKYGICKNCGKEINEDRLKFIPYAEYCVDCQKEINSAVNYDRNTRAFAPKNRPVEEKILSDDSFGFVNNDFDYKNRVEFDGEDSYQSVARFNRRDNIYYDDYFDDENEGYVEEVEKISNQQYKNTLM
ncbi:YteA family regulatory protein [Clostridium tetanomorphum]|uniref:YteA family sporulation protein n=1 Tax=Clostridium tetanomorphum TaxID=1553 RepID=A0A923J0U4_CLOTT|nr:TraR/DksA C4-type zinc finger protein [Clostridium tetanomorphum]KAJ53405.1 dnaK suppressor protein [Clostridium tetanomorphum DSM 665]MBC2396608.1 yteA family sporulation protein [Clostridium tetanomorphum]MBP1863938.1 YteA family regulatory protein [Clostridium tetanomorphum]NRS85016.1 YteA family regulatory protein [Clostridium tetanomorphum]NRZ98232.1 YteA family regulatory protein [Clostridium tetanomorphum]